MCRTGHALTMLWALLAASENCNDSTGYMIHTSFGCCGAASTGFGLAAVAVAVVGSVAATGDWALGTVVLGAAAGERGDTAVTGVAVLNLFGSTLVSIGEAASPANQVSHDRAGLVSSVSG